MQAAVNHQQDAAPLVRDLHQPRPVGPPLDCATTLCILISLEFLITI